MKPAALAARAHVCVALLAGLSGVLLAGSAGATTVVYEPFDYPPETLLDGTPATGQNLTGTWTGGALTQQKLEVTSPGLDYGNLEGAPTPSGGLLNDAAGVTAASGAVAIDEDVLIGPGDTLFWSALFTFSDALNGNHLASVQLRDSATGDLIGFGEAGVGVRSLRVSTQTTATGELIASGADGAFADGQTFLVIGRYVNGVAAGADTLDLIGYDTADAEAFPEIFDPSDPDAEFAYGLADLDIDLTTIDEISFTIRGTDNNFIDELRIGDSYASVVPEPGTALLLGLAVVAGVGASRRPTRPGC